MNKAMNLGFYAMTGRLELINEEADIYRSITREEVSEFAHKIFTKSNSSTLIYRAK
jgi:predicted Zn-dependent peptidase